MRIRNPIEVIGRDPELTMKIMVAIGHRNKKAAERRRLKNLLLTPREWVGWLTRKLLPW